eukprot:5805316-Alexandrium_andersonii.AAC.1
MWQHSRPGARGPPGPLQHRTEDQAGGRLGPTPVSGTGPGQTSGLGQAPRCSTHPAPLPASAKSLGLLGPGLGHPPGR